MLDDCDTSDVSNVYATRSDISWPLLTKLRIQAAKLEGVIMHLQVNKFLLLPFTSLG